MLLSFRLNHTQASCIERQGPLIRFNGAFLEDLNAEVIKIDFDAVRNIFKEEEMKNFNREILLSDFTYVSDSRSYELCYNPELLSKCWQGNNDADGDGFTDSFWFLLPGTSEDGIRQVAAVSIVDNASMVDVNVATRFDRWSTAGQTPADLALSSRLVQPQYQATAFGENASVYDPSDTWTGLFSDPQNTWPGANSLAR